jgi:hypothetical protein
MITEILAAFSILKHLIIDWMSLQLFIMVLFILKHLVFDWLYQPPFMYKNKGTFLHIGGVIHSLLHGVSTFVIVWCFTDLNTAFLAGIIDGVLHYHIDWAKMNINKKFGWTATNSENFWKLVGVDQTLHLLTYIGLICVIVR